MKLIKIPRNIFQTWEISELTPEMNLLTSSWKINNPHYAYFLFNNEERKAFIKNHFDGKIYNAYCKIIPGAFRADLWRYCILYIYGGVIVDLDSLSLNSIDDFLDDKIEFIYKLKKIYNVISCIDLADFADKNSSELLKELEFLKNKIFNSKEKILLVADRSLPTTFNDCGPDILTELQKLIHYLNWQM